MFGKLFSSMYDGSLHGHWEATITLQQLVILSNRHGEVDMTAAAIAARTGIPLELLRTGIAALENPDPESRGPAEEGRRIVRLDPSRSWGWRIVNYLYYRNLASAEDKREGARERQRKHRAASRSVTPGHALSRSSRQAEADADAKAEAKGKKKQAAGRVTFVPADSNLLRREMVKAHGPWVGLPVLDGSFALLSAEHVDDLRAAYPGIEVDHCIGAMRAWLLSNPSKRKTRAGVLRFVNGWLKGEWEDHERLKKGGGRESDAAYAAELELVPGRRRHGA